MTKNQWNFVEQRHLIKCDGEVPDNTKWAQGIIEMLKSLGEYGSSDIEDLKVFLDNIKSDNKYSDDGKTLKFDSSIKIFYSIEDDMFKWYPYVFSDKNGECFIIISVKNIGPISIPVFDKHLDRNMIFKYSGDC